MSTDSFASLGVNSDVVKGLDTKGCKKPAAIHKQAIPVILPGNDCIVNTPNGDEATAIVAIAALQKVDVNTKKTQVIIISPGREAAAATAKFIADVAGSLKIDCFAVKEGAASKEDKAALEKGPHIIVGAPTAISDSVRSGVVGSDVKLLIVEKASDTLDYQGGTDGVSNTIQSASSRKQIFMITSTVSDKVKSMAKRGMTDRYDINKDGVEYRSIYAEEEE